jgi:hypothetical protein
MTNYDYSLMRAKDAKLKIISMLKERCSASGQEEREKQSVNCKRLLDKIIFNLEAASDIEVYLEPERVDNHLSTMHRVQMKDPKLSESGKIPMVEISIRKAVSPMDAFLSDGRVNIRPKHKKTLHVLDFINFTVYSIGTTGYGDMIPNSPRAKFLTTLLNLYEVIFLVIFFNVLLATTAGPKGTEDTEDTDDTDDPEDQKRSGGQSKENEQLQEKLEEYKSAVNNYNDKTTEFFDHLNQKLDDILGKLPKGKGGS